MGKCAAFTLLKASVYLDSKAYIAPNMYGITASCIKQL